MTDTMETRVARLERQVQSLLEDGRVLSPMVSRIDATTGEINAEVKRLKTEVGGLKTEVGDLRDEMREGFERIARLLGGDDV